MALPVDLWQLLERESESVEWKRAGEKPEILEEIVQTLSAFANDAAGTGQGGWVLCGVSEIADEHGFVQAHLEGLTAGQIKTIRGKVRDWCLRRVSPPLAVQDYEDPLEGRPDRRLLAFYVPTSSFLHAYRDSQGATKTFLRSGAETREARGELLRQLTRRKRELPPFLDQPCPGTTLDDLNKLAAEEFLTEARLPLPAAEYLQPGAVIGEGAGALVVAEPLADGRTRPVPTYLAILLFGKEPIRYLPGAYAVLSVYDGSSKTAPHSRRHETSGPLPRLLRDLLERLRLYTGTEIDKSADALGGRQNRQRYSDRALQEAVVNAFAHRDYESREPVRITVFADRIEVANPGGVVPGLDPDRLREGKSLPSWRNPSLARFLFKMGLAQQEGQGIPTIFSETRSIADQDPELRFGPETFEVILPAARTTPAPSSRPTENGVHPEGREGLILLSIGAESIRPVVEESLSELGLEGAEILVDHALTDYVSPDADHWQAEARKIRNEIQEQVEDPRFSRLHLFYRGPVVLAPLVGALIAPVKPLVVYHYENGRYGPAYTLDRRFLRSRS